MNLFSNIKQPKAEPEETKPRFKCGCNYSGGGWTLCPAAKILQRYWVENLTLNGSKAYMRHFKNNKIR